MEAKDLTPEEVLEKLKLASDFFRRTGVLHEILVKQLEFLCRGYLIDEISKLLSLSVDWDMENANYPRRLIFTVESDSKSIKVPELLEKSCEYFLGEEFAIEIVTKKPKTNGKHSKRK